MQELSSLTGIDQALISKYENGKRLPSEKHLLQLSIGMKIPFNSLRNDYLSDKISQLIEFNPQKDAILKKVELQIQNQPTSPILIDLTATSPSVNKQLLNLIPQQKRWLKLLPLSKSQLEILNQNIDLSFVFDCNQLSGNNLSYKDTALIINHNKTIANKSLDEHLETVNLNQGILWVRKAANDELTFSKKFLMDTHQVLFNGISNREVGVYRTQNFNQNAPPAFLVQKLMNEFFQRFLVQQNHLHPILLATQVFERISSISPFATGNEQVAKLMLNFILLKNAYPLTTLGSDIQSGLNLNSALEKSQSDITNKELVLFIVEKVKSAIKSHLKIMA